MARIVKRHLLPLPKGYRSREAASFAAQMEELTERMTRDLARITPAELAWQSKRGQNTIGMLLAHCAIVEMFWLAIAVERWSEELGAKVLDMGMDDDGMPLAPDGAPPRTLRGWTLRDYTRLLARARKFVLREAKGLTDADMDRRITRKRRDGSRSVVSVRWILYHVLEHLAGHYGQMLLLRHQYADRRKRA